MPVMLLVLFGYGVSFDLDAIPIVIVDQDGSFVSRELCTRMLATGEVVEAGRVIDPDEVEGFFMIGDASAALIIPRGFSRDLGAGRSTELQLIIDGGDGSTATQVMAKTEALVTAIGAQLASGGGSIPRAPIEARVSTWFNPEQRSALYLVPGLAGYVLAMVAVLLTALTVAREWERGSMQQLFTTPVSRLEIVIGKLLPYLGLGVLAVLLVLATGAWIFDVPMRGDPLVLVVCSLLFLIGMLGQGLLVSTVTRNQMVATQVATMTSMLPTMLLSGFIFPIENMPLAFRLISYVLPARYYMNTLRGVLLRGNGFAELWGDVLALGIFAVVILVIATRLFRREITSGAK
jgi:ABC-2 type transport system permease protein